MKPLTRSILLLLCVLLVLLPACRTDVALVDSAWGNELRHQGRIAHVRTARTPIAKNASGYRFVLDLVLENDTDQAWSVGAADLAVRSLGKTEDTAGLSPRIDLPVDCVLVTVAAYDDAEVRVPIAIDAPPTATAIALERLPLELNLTQGGQTVLRRKVLVGSFSQPGQAIRVVFLLTAGLVLLSLL